jgi:sulfate transport system ATP-binding protein
VLPSNAQLFQNAGISTHLPEIFLRPHDIVISHEQQPGTALATVNRIIHLGWEVQVELILEDRQSFIAYVTRERFDQLHLRTQQHVFVKPKEAKSFALQSASIN